MSDLARRDGQIQRPAGERPKDALTFLPGEVQDSARYFFGFYSETLKGTYAIANRIRWWMKEDGLTSDEAREAMKRLMTPERSAEIDTSPKAIAALSGEVARILRDRRERDATAKRRKESLGQQPNAAEVEKIKAAIADGMNPNSGA